MLPDAAHIVNTPAPTASDRGTTLRYLPGLDGLRGISVLAVMVFHHYFIFGSERGWMPGGFLGVEVFFVVSGYLITSLLLAERRETGKIDLKHFWVRRARRLLPALYVLLAVVVAYSLLFLPDSIATLKGDVIAALTYTSNWWQIIAHRSYFVTAGRPELLKHLWSLAIEEQFYLCWPPLLILGLRHLGRRRMLIAMYITIATSSILLAVISLYSVNFAYYATFTRLSGLLLGAVMAFFYAPYRIRNVPGRGARVALDVAGGSGLLALLATFGALHWLIGFHGFTFPEANTGNIDRSVFFGGFLIVDLATLLVIAAAVHPASDVGRLLAWRPLQWTGLRSYSLYLWHYPIFCVTRPTVDFRDLGHLHGWPVFVLRFGLTFGAAELSYRFVETPIRKGALSRYRQELRTAHGKQRQRLARRGVLVASSLSAVVIVLGAGLAGAQPQVEHIAGPSNGSAADPSAVAALQGGTSTTTAPEVSTVPGTGATGHASSTTTTTRPKSIPKVLAIGDSVMLGAKRALEADIPGIAVDAAVSRQFSQALSVMSYYKSKGLIPPVVVIHLGTNGTISNQNFDEMMQLIGPGHQVYFLTARVPRLWETEVNNSIHAGVQRWKNAHVLEWRDYSGCHDNWFVNDGFHLQPPGQRGYAAFVLSGLEGHPLTTCTK
jgi:peptidoglycan/LPS O-acetylase OafA/YrhL